MFDTLSQFCTFIACVGFGAVTGILVSISSGLKYIVKNKPIKILSDTFVFILIGLLYIAYSYSFNFSSLRLYMIFGVFMGIVVYMKSFHILLAKIGKKAYNIIQIRKDKIKHERRKDEKGNSSDDDRRRIASRRSSCSNGISTDFNKRSQKKRKGVRRTDSNLQRT